MTEKNAGNSASPVGVTTVQRWFGFLLVTLSLCLGVVAGMWVGRAWEEGDTLAWITGIVSLACAVMVAIAGLRRSHAPQQHRRYQPPAQAIAPVVEGPRALPLLGELLVNKYQIISERQLQEALKEQQNRGGRLGQLLVALGYIEYPRLAEVLEDQVAYGDPWRGLPFADASIDRDHALLGFR